MTPVPTPLADRLALPLDGVPADLAALPPGRLAAYLGLDAASLRSAVENAAVPALRLLLLDLGEVGSATRVVARILDDLADLALALWPEWPASPAGTLPMWRSAAAKLAAAGRRPRFRKAAPRIELRELLAVVDPGLVLAAEIETARPQAAGARIAALEWCAAAGARIALLCPEAPPPVAPFDRILYGAVTIARPAPPPSPVLDRLVVPRGKPHGGSAIEARLCDAISRDAELAPLFAFNRRLTTTAPGFAPCVDLVWETGRVAVEIDGAEHQGNPDFAEDRHRDYELLVAGYLVLRLTNAQVVEDLAYALEKIRRVVRFRQSQGRFA